MRLRLRGRTRTALFQSAAQGLFHMLVQVTTVRPRQARHVRVRAATLEEALVLWMQEWLFLFHTRRFVGARFVVNLTRPARSGWMVKGAGWGERLDRVRHRPRSLEVKAVTYHDVRVRRVKAGWMTDVVLDV